MRWDLIFLVMLTCSAGAAPPTVKLKHATVTGTWSQTGDVAAYLGIPFAKPPVRDRRWRPPEPLELVNDFDATNFATACMQSNYLVNWYHSVIESFSADPDKFPVPSFGEDCLYLNVWVPNTEAGEQLPVMVWIHGGSHRGGWSYEPNYIGEALARKGIVVVSIAYRVDVFGFFSHPDLEAANFGLLDQMAALRWVRRNIRRFGGDPKNVTVFGESAGAASIGYLLAVPDAAALFDKYIHQSAGYEATTTDLREEFVEHGRSIEKWLEVDGGIDALRRVPAADVLAAADAVYSDYRPGVVVDGVTVSETFTESLRAGRLSAKPVLIGTNADEWKMYLPHPVTAEDFAAAIDAYAPGREAALKNVFRSDESLARRVDRLTTAHEFVCPSLELAAKNAAAGQPSYVYYFARVREGPLAASIGAYHGAEIPYVFDRHDAWLPTDDDDRRLTRSVMAYWTSFARLGEPSPTGDDPEWLPYDREQSSTLFLDATPRVVPHPERELCAALDADAAEGALE